MNRVIKMESCAGSSSKIEVVHNPENDKYGIYITDETGYTDLIALNHDQVEIFLKTVSDYVRARGRSS